MTFFWTLAALFTVVSLLFIFVPLIRNRSAGGGPATNEAMEAKVSVYRSQLAELEADRETGTISEAQFHTAQVDLQRSLLEANEGHSTAPTGARTGSWHWPAGVVSLLTLPVLAVLIYQGLGAGAAGLDPQARVPQAQTSENLGIESAIQALYTRLEANPEDPGSWALLGRSLMFLDQPREAAGAYAQAIRYGGGEDPDILVSYADLLGTLDNGNLASRAGPFIERALEIDADHVNGRWLAGLAAFQAGDFRTAQGHWQTLLTLFDPNSEEAQIIRTNLDEVADRLQEASADDEPADGTSPERGSAP